MIQTHDLSVMRRALYRSATTAAQLVMSREELPKLVSALEFKFNIFNPKYLFVLVSSLSLFLPQITQNWLFFLLIVLMQFFFYLDRQVLSFYRLPYTQGEKKHEECDGIEPRS